MVAVAEVLLDAEFDELFDERFVFGFHKGYAFVRFKAVVPAVEKNKETT